MITGVIISHGHIGQAMLNACKQITGTDEHLSAMSIDGLAPETILERLRAVVHAEKGEGVFVLVCMRGGTAWNAACRVTRECDNVKLISGLNLSMLLSFVTKRNRTTFEDLAAIVLQDGVRGITISN